jgi:hypothetical protein
MELKSLSQRIKCAKLESRSLRMFLECLGSSFMRLGVPFIAPKQLGAVGGQQGRLFLPSVGWRTGQSGARSPSYSGADDRCRFVAVGAPNTVRCTPDSPVPPADRWRAMRRLRIARSTVALAAVGSPDSPVHHRTVR